LFGVAEIRGSRQGVGHLERGRRRRLCKVGAREVESSERVQVGGRVDGRGAGYVRWERLGTGRVVQGVEGRGGAGGGDWVSDYGSGGDVGGSTARGGEGVLQGDGEDSSGGWDGG
jgi:hypothetical protein